MKKKKLRQLQDLIDKKIKITLDNVKDNVKYNEKQDPHEIKKMFKLLYLLSAVCFPNL